MFLRILPQPSKSTGATELEYQPKGPVLLPSPSFEICHKPLKINGLTSIKILYINGSNKLNRKGLRPNLQKKRLLIDLMTGSVRTPPEGGVKRERGTSPRSPAAPGFPQSGTGGRQWRPGEGREAAAFRPLPCPSKQTLRTNGPQRRGPPPKGAGTAPGRLWRPGRGLRP